MHLYMIKLGATPKGRLIEQHDIFFGIGKSVAELIPHFEKAWADIKDIWHIDAYRTVSRVGGYRVRVVERETFVDNGLHLYFINMGGYKAGEFEEFHHKLLVVAHDIAGAISLAKQSTFYQEFDAGGRAVSHIDDKHGVDIDDIHKVSDVLNDEFKAKYALQIEPCDDDVADEIVIGYLPKKLFYHS
ncbi:Domain of Uncharacterised Function (DUF1543) [Moraxella lacunata]|uniref:Domain of Uncharacterized Function (DUF1543) n=1 Tax=Moraxella lacunata TaxID=477 RepID=A0A1V4GMB6_MORLA|nr:DUF1543 domain-containing protein [Moraxella lacunata]OPH33558.1 hypothetical protein B5J94_12890 [Moraxella lacunata]STZ00402.1 Domain of Uncharacterised Function (DUF1543) [Moraxella lacunata]